MIKYVSKVLVILILLAFTFIIAGCPPQNEIEDKNEELLNGEVPTVYKTNDISPNGLIAIYNALGHELEGKVAVKISTGEPGGTNYLAPALIKDLVQSVEGTIVECNTAYGGRRSTAAEHKKVAEEHGFTDIATVDIMDEDGEISLPIKNGENITENFVGSNFTNYDSYIILSHFKGHAMGGFGGAIKNMSIGIASANGKMWIHTSGAHKEAGDIPALINAPHDNFLESMAEAASSIMYALGDNIVYINIMNNLSVDCDCSSNPADPTMQDIGILASLDPVAVDQACVDLVYEAHDGHDLIERMESRNGIHTLEHAVKLDLGSRTYEIINIDE